MKSAHWLQTIRGLYVPTDLSALRECVPANKGYTTQPCGRLIGARNAVVAFLVIVLSAFGDVGGWIYGAAFWHGNSFGRVIMGDLA